MKDNLPKVSKQYGLERKGYILSMQYIQAGYIVHRISAEPGQSGAPVISTNGKGESTIIGIHIGSTENNIKKYQNEYNLKKVNLTKVMNK